MAGDSPGVRRRRTAVAIVASALLAVGGLAAGCGDDNGGASSSWPAGTPAEVSDNAGNFSAPNGDYNNTRAVGGNINAGNISTLTEAWTYPLTGESTFGVFSSNPVATKDTVYLQDISSNVFAVDKATGETKWEHKFDAPTTGPNGVALGGGMVVGGTATSAFALDAETGELKWEKKLVRQPSEGIDMAPLVWNDTVIVSTVPSDAGISYDATSAG